MMRKFLLFFFCCCFIFSVSKAQDSTHHSPFTFSGYVDVYAATYNDSVGASNFQKFPTVSPRSNQFGLNVAMFTAKYSTEKIRSTVAVHFGDIARSTWSGNYPFVQEANVGFRLSKKVWLDGGLFRTHFGTECLLPKENYTSSVAVATFFEPYYEAGFKLNYNASEKLTLNFFVFNGYGIYDDNNQKKSAGVLATYVFNDRWNVGYSNYIGDESSDTNKVSMLRSFHNFFFNYHYKKFRFTTGVDLNWQQHSYINKPNQSAFMYTALAIADYQIAKLTDVYCRAEMLNDAQGFMTGIMTDKNNVLTGLKVWGATLGVQYKPTENSYVRLETRYLAADKAQEIFYWNGEHTNTRMEWTVNMGVWF
ncbi:MAG: hypothetical protein RJA07_645 [Bacteroidota bacterium]